MNGGRLNQESQESSTAFGIRRAMECMTVTAFIDAAFAAARTAHRSTLEQWLSASVVLHMLLPDSRLMLTVQRIGNLDVLLRAMEDEAAVVLKCVEDGTEGLDLTRLLELSTIWVGDCYEVFRLLKSRGLLVSEALDSLERQLKILRIPLDKHEISDDRLLEEPLLFGALGSDGQFTNMIEYDKTDKKSKAHAMPTSLSERGSLRWYALDVSRGSVTARWIERRSVSEQILALVRDLPRS